MKEQNLQSYYLLRHGGVPIAPDSYRDEMKVETKPARAGTDGEGEGSTFIIQLQNGISQ